MPDVAENNIQRVDQRDLNFTSVSSELESHFFPGVEVSLSSRRFTSSTTANSASFVRAELSPLSSGSSVQLKLRPMTSIDDY